MFLLLAPFILPFLGSPTMPSHLLMPAVCIHSKDTDYEHVTISDTYVGLKQTKLLKGRKINYLYYQMEPLIKWYRITWLNWQNKFM